MGKGFIHEAFKMVKNMPAVQASQGREQMMETVLGTMENKKGSLGEAAKFGQGINAIRKMMK